MKNHKAMHLKTRGRIRKTLEKQIALFFNKVMGSGLAQDENTDDGSRYITPGMPEKVRELAEEGIVLLENDGRVSVQALREIYLKNFGILGTGVSIHLRFSVVKLTVGDGGKYSVYE